MADLRLIKNDLEALTAPTRADLTAIWQKILQQQQDLIDRWPTLKPAERRRALRDLEQQVTAVIPAAGQLQIVVADIVREAYQRGAHRTAGEVRQSVRYSQQDRDARALFEADTYSELLQATQHVKQTTKELVRYLAKEHAADRLLGNTTAQQAARDLADDLTGRGISAIVYKDGSRHGLDDYTDMLLRTKTAEAYQLGGFNQARGLGVRFMELLDNPACGVDGHDDPRKANGLILPLEEAARFPISHPRCVRVTTPRVDILTAEDARRGSPSTTPEQDADQAGVERRRLEAASRRAGRRRAVQRLLEERTARSLDGGLLTRTGAVTAPAARRHSARLAARLRRLDRP